MPESTDHDATDMYGATSAHRPHAGAPAHLTGSPPADDVSDWTSLIDRWKAAGIYPFDGEPSTAAETVEREIFSKVASVIATHLPGFGAAPAMDRAFQLRMLRHAIETQPKALARILDEVLHLPREQQESISAVLADTSLPAVCSTASLVTERLRFLSGLEAILFDDTPRKRIKERSQLHRIIAENCWLFGEDFTLSVDDRSLTEVLRAHKRLLGEHVAIDEPVRHPTLGGGIVDLMLSKATRLHRPRTLTHLVVELKAPGVKIDVAEVGQIEKYARTVMDDPRFREAGVTWQFCVISDELGEYVPFRSSLDAPGLIYQRHDVTIYAKTWAQVIDENRSRLKFLEEKLELQIDKASALKLMHTRYARFLKEAIPANAWGDPATSLTA
ncbi:protein of unknown function [Pararobbsia alpina]|uniref:histidine kinase n=1 Tax=Pararobbsia alpina TaxID=621374 RepID=UPI0039A70743